MKKITMTKYGFVRWSEKDFVDDGNKFTCYRAGKNVRVSKHVSDGEVYLSIDSSSAGNGTLPYDAYSKLPHYKEAVWSLNGVQLEPLTDEDIKDFYEACLAYEAEYEAAEATFEFPTLEQLKAKAAAVTAKTLMEIDTVKQLLSAYPIEAAMKFSEYEWRLIQRYIRELHIEKKRFDPDTFPQTVLGKSSSYEFMHRTGYMKESYWFRYIVDLFKEKGFEQN